MIEKKNQRRVRIMIDEIKKMINDDNEVLNILPQNNVNNRKKYRA